MSILSQNKCHTINTTIETMFKKGIQTGTKECDKWVSIDAIIIISTILVGSFIITKLILYNLDKKVRKNERKPNKTAV